MDDLPRRTSMRLLDFDYSNFGYYFVTICTHKRRCNLAKVVGEKSFLSPLGRIVDGYITTINDYYSGVSVEEYQIMPNHVHIIIQIMGTNGSEDRNGRTRGSAPTLGIIIKRLKTMTTHQYIEGIHTYNWPSFNGRIWQRNYYEHIVRNDMDLERIRKYIHNNPINWTKDKLFHL